MYIGVEQGRRCQWWCVGSGGVHGEMRVSALVRVEVVVGNLNAKLGWAIGQSSGGHPTTFLPSSDSVASGKCRQ